MLSLNDGNIAAYSYWPHVSIA